MKKLMGKCNECGGHLQYECPEFRLLVICDRCAEREPMKPMTPRKRELGTIRGLKGVRAYVSGG